LDAELARVETVWPGPNLTDTYVTVRAWCVKAGRGLGQKEHESDRWVAATAIWLGVALIAHDAIFAERTQRGTPGRRLRPINVLIRDTGPLVAAALTRDPDHRSCVDRLRPVIAEAGDQTTMR